MLDMDKMLCTKEKKKPTKKKLTKKEQQILEMAENTVMPMHYATVWTSEDLNRLCEWVAKQEVIAVDTETTGVNVFKDSIVGISLYAPHQGWYIPIKHLDSVEETPSNPRWLVGTHYVKCLPKDLIIRKLKPLLEDPKKKLIWHNYKFDFHVLRRFGIKVNCYFDTLVAQSLLDENVSKKLKDLAPLYLGIPSDTFSKLFGKETFDTIPILMDPEIRRGNLASYYACKDAELTYLLYKFQISHLDKPPLKSLKNLLFKVEIPFLKVVAAAEEKGVRVDTDYLVNTVAKKLHKEVEELRQKIWSYSGEFNINSWQQKSKVLYDKLNLPKVNKKNPRGTDQRTLKLLRKHHPIAALLLEYSSKNKLVTAFADKLPREVINGRIHPSFNTTGTVTGRMSCSNPNLQQIPSKDGSAIRNAFIADEGRVLVSIDYSQQELRVLTHVSKCPVLSDIYANGKDVHSTTAVGIWNNKHFEKPVTYEQYELGRKVAEIFADADGNLIDDHFTETYIQHLVDTGKLSKEEADKGPTALKELAVEGKEFSKFRSKAKIVNFGIIYGMSEMGLSGALEITEQEASEYIASYYATYPGVVRWKREMKKEILSKGFSTTLAGRKRRVYKEIRDRNQWMQEAGIRKATNSVIQGTSADMVKLASLKLQPALKKHDCSILLWVHDEVIIDAPENISPDVLKSFADIMCSALPLDCGLKADIEIGKKWGQKMSEDDLQELVEIEV